MRLTPRTMWQFICDLWGIAIIVALWLAMLPLYIGVLVYENVYVLLSPRKKEKHNDQTRV